MQIAQGFANGTSGNLEPMEFISPRGLAKRHAGSDTEQKRFQSTQLSLQLRDTGTPVPAPGLTVWNFNSNLTLHITINLEKCLLFLCLSFPSLRELKAKEPHYYLSCTVARMEFKMTKGKGDQYWRLSFLDGRQ